MVVDIPEDPPTPTLEQETIRILRIETVTLRRENDLLSRLVNGLEARVERLTESSMRTREEGS